MLSIIIYFVSLVICLFCRKQVFNNIIKKVKYVIGVVPLEDELHLVCNIILVVSYIPFLNTFAAIILGIVAFFKFIRDSHNNFLNKDI